MRLVMAGVGWMVRLRRSVGSEKSALRVNSPGRNTAVLTTTSVAPCLTAAKTLRSRR